MRAKRAPVSSTVRLQLESKAMIEYLGLGYGILKDIASYLSFDEEDKTVDMKWLDISGFKKKAESDGFELRWVKLSNVESKKFDGFEIMYEVDKAARKRRRLIVNNELILMGKKEDT